MKRDMGSLIGGLPAQHPRWYVVQSQPHKELYSATQLRNQGFRPFVPRIRKTVRHARQMKSVLAPLFPRYLFVSLDLSRDRWRSVRGTFGVSSLVMKGDRPAPVPDGVVEQLIAHTTKSEVIDFLPELTPGQTVRFLRGPFAEKIGRLVSLDATGRVAVLLKIMGSERSVKVPAESLMPVAH
jgi:transcriptional antiterminator RfaH